MLLGGIAFSLWAMAAIILVMRLTGGLGAVTNLSDQFPLGIWIGFDVMAGAMLGGGAFVLAGLVYVFGLERLPPDPALDHPDRLPGLLAADRGADHRHRAALQHLAAAAPPEHPLGAVRSGHVRDDLHHRAGAGIRPALFERLRWRRAWRITHAITLPLVILGILLSTMHQSSLGSLWLIAPGKLNDLWYTPWLPVFFWISAITVGLGMVMVESNLTSRGLQARPGAGPAGPPGPGQRVPAGLLRRLQAGRPGGAGQGASALRAQPAGRALLVRAGPLGGAACRS